MSVFHLSLHARRVRLYPDYSVAQAGLLMLMKELANELGPHGIRVNAERLDRSAAVVPRGRVGAPDAVAKPIEFLADAEASGYVTGADLHVDGGLDQYNWLHHLGGV